MQVIHTNKSFFKVALIIFPSLLFLLPSGIVSALTYQNSVDVDFTINPSLSINLSANNLVIDNLTPGSSSDSNIITVDVATNAGYGYYMSATASTSTGNTDLTNQSSSTAKFTNLVSNTATLDVFPDNYWGYSYSTDNGSTWISGSQGDTATGYNGLPLDNDDSGATGVILASTDSFANAGSVKFKIGAKASATQASGTYTNTVNFYAVANPEPSLAPVACEAGKICYNVNSLTATEGTMGEQEKDDSDADIADGATVTLLASNFSRQGYGFAGWSDSFDYATNPNAKFYGPMETITVPTGTTANGLSLYAVWVKSQGSIQDQSKVASVCSSLITAPTDGTANLSSVSALTDQRDNNTYAIAKLADGKCWMIENLRLENTNSDNSTGALAQGYGTSATYGNFSGLATAESTGFSSTYSANSLYSNDGGNDTVNIGTSDSPANRMPRYNNLNTQSRAQNSPNSNTFLDNNTNGGMYSYGNYYTWHAAIADTTYYSSGDHGTTSLCPTGWRLPIGNQSTATNSFGALSVALGGPEGGATADRSSTPTGAVMSKTFRSYPNNFLYSGYFTTSSAYGRGSDGSYWSSTAKDYSLSYRLLLNSSSVTPGTSSFNKNNGYSIRCTVGS